MQLRPSLSISYSTIHRLTLPQNPTQVRVGRFSRFANAFRTPSSRGYSTGSGRGVNTSSSSEPTSSSGEIGAGRDGSRESLRSGSNELESSSRTHASTAIPSPDTSTRTNTDTTTLSASDKLFLDAAREESSSAPPNKSSYLQYLESQYLNPTSSPNWDGDERMEDAVLRMLVDKYKPLRYGGGTGGGGVRSAEEKLKERPPRVIERQLDVPGIVEEFERNAKANANASVDDEGSAVTTTATIGNSSVSSLSKTTPSSGSWATESLLPSSEPHRPWHTEYRVPSHVVSSIKLANIPPPPVPPHLRSTGSTVSSSTPLPSSPRLGSTGGGGTKDEKALKKEKEMKKRSETGTRLGRARESTLDYRLGVRDKVLGSQGVNRDGVGGGGARPNPVSMRGWTGLIEDRIERARSRGVFNNLKGRGKPLTSTMEEKNPFIGREEYLMNRIVQRNGAAPPWVELQGELDNTLQTFRSVLRQSYVRRAIRVLITLHPPNVLSRLTIADIQARRDKEWEKKEETYHDTAVEEVNALVRKYNGLAPYAVRRAYYMRKVEVERVYEECAEEVLEGIKERLRTSGGSGVGVTSGGSDVQRIGGGFGAANGREEDPGFVGLGDWIWGMVGRVMGRWRG